MDIDRIALEISGIDREIGKVTDPAGLPFINQTARRIADFCTRLRAQPHLPIFLGGRLINDGFRIGSIGRCEIVRKRYRFELGFERNFAPGIKCRIARPRALHLHGQPVRADDVESRGVNCQTFTLANTSASL